MVGRAKRGVFVVVPVLEQMNAFSADEPERKNPVEMDSDEFSEMWPSQPASQKHAGKSFNPRWRSPSNHADPKCQGRICWFFSFSSFQGTF